MQLRLTPAVKALLIACVASFLIQQTGDQFLNTHFVEWFGLIPSDFAIEHRFWQIFTYAFLHSDIWHLVFNMMLLVFIGGDLEASWGSARFLRFYFTCTVAAGCFYLLLQLLVWHGQHQPMVGASGGIYGLLAAYGLIYGERVMLFMMLFPMKAKHFVWILAGIEFMSTVYSGRGGLASAAHLGGMAAGFASLWSRAAWVVFQRQRVERGQAPKREKKRRGSQHLKLVIDNKKVPRTPRDPDDADDGSPKTWH